MCTIFLLMANFTSVRFLILFLESFLKRRKRIFKTYWDILVFLGKTTFSTHDVYMEVKKNTKHLYYMSKSMAIFYGNKCFIIFSGYKQKKNVK